MLLGTRDEGSPLCKLAGHVDVLEAIWVLVERERALDALRADKECVAFAHVDDVSFPTPKGRNVNMMPFRLDDLSTLPADLQKDYGYMIKVCRNNLRGCRDEQRKPKYSVGQAKAQATPMPEDMRIAYLTVQESVVNEGESQRRSGLHTEGFAYLPFEAGKQECVRERVWEPWGYGDALHGEFTGGIFMASDVDDSTHVYNCRVPEILVGAGGDVEHLRPILNEIMPLSAEARYEDGAGDTIGSAHLIEGGVQRVLWPISLQAEQLFWMTDHTPHESRPLEKGQHRCYFRLVTGRVGAWFAAHSTPNPLGTQPNARIITHDKFTGKPPPAKGDSKEEASAAAAAPPAPAPANDATEDSELTRLERLELN